jgi:hypothetical protein
MASAAAAISNLSATTPGSLPGNKVKIEPVAGTAKIIHPDDDISLASLIIKIKLNNFFYLGRISCFFAEI